MRIHSRKVVMFGALVLGLGCGGPADELEDHTADPGAAAPTAGAPSAGAPSAGAPTTGAPTAAEPTAAAPSDAAPAGEAPAATPTGDAPATGVVAAGATSWSVTAKPPTMTSPTVITLPGSYLKTYTHRVCSGPAYIVNLDDSKDYVIKATQVLHAPVQINGGRNVRIVGLELDLDSSVCASVGTSGSVPATIALLVQQVGTTFIEGTYIDVRGKSADCVVARNRIGGTEALSKGYGESAARGARDVVIQNSVCRGYAGDSNTHGDLIQTQGLHELFRNIVIENVSVDSLCEGTMLLPRDGYHLAGSIRMRNFDYRWDTRYPRNLTGIPALNSAKSTSYSSVYSTIASIDDYYAPVSGEHRAVAQNGSVGVYIPNTPAARFATPGTGAASDAWIGIHYVSPHPL